MARITGPPSDLPGVATIDLPLEIDPDVKGGPGLTLRINSQGEAVEPENAVVKDGRKYVDLGEGKYVLPNDAKEQDRLDFQSEMCSMILDGKFGLAPIKNPEYVLDIATGTGRWALDFAQDFPQSKVFGTDVSKIQRKSPVSNFTFVQQDVEKEDWGFDHKFDYIHMRYIVGCFDDTAGVFKKSFDALKPGGYIEIMDIVANAVSVDDSIEGTFVQKWAQLVFKGAQTVGRDMHKPTKYKRWLEEAGFVDVVEKTYRSPGNSWPKDPRAKAIGAYQLQCLLGILPSMSQLLKLAGVEQPEAEELLAKVAEDMSNTAIHLHWDMPCLVARKPE